MSSYDINDVLKVSIQPSITGQSLWKISPNFCDPDQSYSLEPSAGKQLYITQTKLDFSKDVTFNEPAGFQILMGNTVIYNKTYNDIWDFVHESDEYHEYFQFNRFLWYYGTPMGNPINLKSSLGMSFKVLLPQNGIMGTRCHLGIKCISMDE